MFWVLNKNTWVLNGMMYVWEAVFLPEWYHANFKDGIREIKLIPLQWLYSNLVAI